MTLMTKGKPLVTKGKDLGDKKNDLDDQRKDLNESKAAMPQIVKQTGWAKPNQLPAGPRKKRRLCRRLFSSNIILFALKTKDTRYIFSI